MQLTTTILSLAAIGHDLSVALVAITPAGARVTHAGVLSNALRSGPGELRDLLSQAGMNPSGARIVFTCPSGSASMRPIALGMAQWPKAREEVLASIGRLFPMTRENALVGFVESSSAEPRQSSNQSQHQRGFLFAIRRDLLDPWSQLIEQATGRTPDVVLIPPMVTLGLGLQDTEHSGVIEHSPTGMLTIHRLTFGEIASLSEPWSHESDDTAALSGIRLLEFPSEYDQIPGIDQIDPSEYAAAAAIASIVGSGRIAPIIGRTHSRLPSWIVPAAAVLLAALLLGVSVPLSEARVQRALAEAQQQEESLQPEFVRISNLRQDASERLQSLESVVSGAYDRWVPVMPDLVALRETLPEGAFLYRYMLAPDHITIHGEAPRAADVLLALESSDDFSDAEQVTPPAVVDERGLERFHIRARRDEGGFR